MLGSQFLISALLSQDNGKTTTVVFVGVYNDGAGTNNIQLSPFAFDVLEDFATEVLLDVVWAFL